MVKKLKGGMSYTKTLNEDTTTIVGLSLGLSAAEIEEALEADPQGIEDVPAVDSANRKVWPIWILAANAEDDAQQIQRYDDIPVLFRERPEGSSFVWFAYNASLVTITAGAVTITASWVFDWMRD